MTNKVKDDNRSQQETNYLLSTSANRESLFRGIKSVADEKLLMPEEWERMTKKDN